MPDIHVQEDFQNMPHNLALGATEIAEILRDRGLVGCVFLADKDGGLELNRLYAEWTCTYFKPGKLEVDTEKIDESADDKHLRLKKTIMGFSYMRFHMMRIYKKLDLILNSIRKSSPSAQKSYDEVQELVMRGQ